MCDSLQERREKEIKINLKLRAVYFFVFVCIQSLEAIN